ncbi:sensor domain-containing diguanylate cyclase [Halomonas sp. N3-2A]|uniref:sensor domain-containing diguanylate cyclase n=1 Tax=Halomonas sp. N3-2A TaxID=2014541 RepID=UPI000B5B2ED9|nr:diguanylate cyclase [Halomonas sp. N3-2A]ASK18981.1 diguanylate cyclase [Halomonas sp. N3-2A]
MTLTLNGKSTQRHRVKRLFFRLISFPFTTLRGRLVIGAVVLWSLLCLIVLTFGWKAGRLLVNETNNQHLRYEAELISNSITFQVNERVRELERLAERVMLPREGALLEHHAYTMEPLFEALLVYDLNSKIVDEWPADGGAKGYSFADREYARFMHAFKTPYVSEPLIGRISNTPLVLMLVPMHDNQGRYTGFLGGLVNIKQSRLFKNFEQIRLGDNGYVTITTASGQRIYAPGQQEAIVILPDNISPVLDKALDGWEGESVGRSLSDEPQLVAYRQIWPANWIVGVHLPQDQAEAPLIAGMKKITVYAWGVLILILPLVWGVIWITLRSLAHLAQQVQELQDGRRSVLNIPTSAMELRRVIDVINATESARQTSLSDLVEQEAMLRGTLSASPLGMFVTDQRGHLTFINDSLHQLLGDDAPNSLNDWSDRVHCDDRQDVRSAWLRSLVKQSSFARQFRFVGTNQELYWLDIHTAAIRVNDKFIGTVGTVRDITQHYNDYAQKNWEAEHDPLTRLLNRRGLRRHLKELFNQWQSTEKPTAVILFDLDHFKPVNDQGGHALGDQMLQQIASVIQNEVRSSDYTARQGGDEFAILLPGCTPERAPKIAESLRASIAACSIEGNGRQWKVTASIGVSHFHKGDKTIDDVLSRADAASYRAKKSGRNKIEASEVKPKFLIVV